MNKKSQKLYSTLAATALVASAVAPVASAADTTVTTTPLTKANFGTDAVKNAIGTSGDTVTVTSLTGPLTVKVYSDSTAKTKIGEKAITTGDTSAVVTVTDGFKEFKKVYVTVQKEGEKESKAFAVNVPKEQTARLESDKVTVNNNVTLKDEVVVKGLVAKDKVTVYSDEAKTKKIGTASVKTDEAKVTVSKGFGDLSKVYVTLTSTNKTESDVLEVSVTSEDTTVLTSTDIANIEISNGIKTDKVLLKNVKKGEVYTVYKDNADINDKKAIIGTLKVKADAETAEIKISKTFNGLEKVYIVKQANNAQPSDFELFTVGAEPVTEWTSADAAKIITNNTIKKDTVTITGAKKDDVYTVYSSTNTEDKKAKIGTVKVKADGDATISISKTFKGIDVIYVSKQEKDKNVSGLVSKTVTPEPKTEWTSADTVTVSNLVKFDTVEIDGAQAGDVYTVYKDSDTTNTKNKIGTLKVKTAGKNTIKISKSFDGLAKVYVTKQAADKAESSAKILDVPEEPTSQLASGDTVTITNNFNINDVFTLTGVEAKDKVEVFKGTESIGKATVSAKANGTLEIKLKKDVTSADTVTFKLTRLYHKESNAIEVKVGSEISYSSATKELTINGVKKNTGFNVVTSSTGDTSTAVAEAKATTNGDLKVKVEKATAGVQYYIYTTGSAPKLVGTFRQEN